MKTLAAVLWEVGAPVEIVEVDLAPPQEGEVLVKIAACGVCHSDLHVVDGHLPEPLPLVLGHEASGEVVGVGPRVERLREGDHVVLALVPHCGECAACRGGRTNFCELTERMAATGTLADGTTRLSYEGTPLHHFNAVSSFAAYAVVPESAAVAIPAEVELDAAALVGCSALTGYGAVHNTAQVEPGSSVAVWGCGGVGLNIVQSARLAEASPIIAVDKRPEKLEAARRLGATDVVLAGPNEHVVGAVRTLSGGGVDYAFEVIGLQETVAEAWEAAGSGGMVVVVGLLPKGAGLTIDAWHLLDEKALKGCFLGSARIDRDIPRIVDLYREGKLQLEELLDRRIPLEELPAAFERLRAGEGIRQLVVFD